MTTDIGRLTGSRASMEPASGLHPSGFDPERNNGCNCRLCSYDREFAAHLARIPEGEHEFFEELKGRWEHADFDAQWWRNGEAEPPAELFAALRNMVGQVEQARDGFGIWPYANSESMSAALTDAHAAIASAIEAQRAETAETGSVADESAASEAGDAR